MGRNLEWISILFEDFGMFLPFSNETDDTKNPSEGKVWLVSYAHELDVARCQSMLRNRYDLRVGELCPSAWRCRA
jgi:hypothetical protein